MIAPQIISNKSGPEGPDVNCTDVGFKNGEINVGLLGESVGVAVGGKL